MSTGGAGGTEGLAAGGVAATAVAAAVPLVSPLAQIWLLAQKPKEDIEDIVRMKEPLQVSSACGQRRLERPPTAPLKEEEESSLRLGVNGSSQAHRAHADCCNTPHETCQEGSRHARFQGSTVSRVARAQAGEARVEIWGEDALLQWPGARRSVIAERDAYMARTIWAAATGARLTSPTHRGSLRV